MCFQEKKRKQPTVAGMYSRTAPYTADNAKVDRLNTLLVELICREGLPMRLVDSNAFKAN